MLESAIGRNKSITVQLLYQNVVFQMLPAKVKESLDVMAGEGFDQPRIYGGVYNDAHASWSIAMSRLSSRNEKMCCRGIVG